MKFLHNFFLTHEVIFSSHIMFINTSTKEFTLVSSTIQSHDIALEHFLYHKMVASVFENRHIPFWFVNRFLSR